MSTSAETLSYPSPTTFYVYLAGRFLATVAMQIQSVAVGWHIYDITHSPMALGFVGLVQFVPMAAFILPAGDLADRFERRFIIVGSFLVQAVSAGVLCALVLMKVTSILPYYGALVMFGVARAFAAPAGQSFLPQLVPPERLAQAVAWSTSTFMVAVIAGPALGGFVYALGSGAAFALCSVLAFLVALLMMGLQVAKRTIAPRADTHMVERVAEGIRFIRHAPVLLGAISLDLFAVLLGGATALLPIYARDILHVGPFGLGLLRSAPAAGAAVVGLLLTQKPLKRNAGRIMFACVGLFGVATIVFGLSTNLYVSLAALFVLGASDMVSVNVRSTLVQLGTPDAMRGRVSSVYMLFVGASNELGEFESGLTASWFGTVASVVVGGFGTLAVVALWAVLFPALARIDRLADVKPQAPEP